MFLLDLSQPIRPEHARGGRKPKGVAWKLMGVCLQSVVASATVHTRGNNQRLVITTLCSVTFLLMFELFNLAISTARRSRALTQEQPDRCNAAGPHPSSAGVNGSSNQQQLNQCQLSGLVPSQQSRRFFFTDFFVLGGLFVYVCNVLAMWFLRGRNTCHPFLRHN